MKVSGYIVFLTAILFSIVLVQAGKDKPKGQKGDRNRNRDKDTTPNPNRKTNDGSRPYCYKFEENPYVYFGTKTAYRWNRNKDDDEVKHPTCEASQMWLLSRHGTRNPGTDRMIFMRDTLPLLRTEILANHARGKGSLCAEDRKKLSEWEFRASVTEDKWLVKEGKEEMEDIADRYQDRFPQLLPKTYSNLTFTFRVTASERTTDSAKAFAKGLFGKKALPNVTIIEPDGKDDLLRFYKSCKRWKTEVDDNDTATEEVRLYQASEDFQGVIKNVSRRLGFETDLNMTMVDVMYDMCSFDKAWKPKRLSPWCSAFSAHDLEVIEYRDDLEYFYEDGYGFEINYKQACPLLKDVVEKFENKKAQPGEHPNGIFYFTHSGTLLKFMTRLGLHKDDTPVLHNNRVAMANRRWRTSIMDSFGSNVAMILFKCAADYKVGTYVQEKLVRLPGCAEDLCSFEEFKKEYGTLAASCNLDQICRL